MLTQELQIGQCAGAMKLIQRVSALAFVVGWIVLGTCIASPLTEGDIVELLKAGVGNDELVSEIEKSGVEGVDVASLKAIREAGGDSALLIQIQKSRSADDTDSAAKITPVKKNVIYGAAEKFLKSSYEKTSEGGADIDDPSVRAKIRWELRNHLWGEYGRNDVIMDEELLALIFLYGRDPEHRFKVEYIERYKDTLEAFVEAYVSTNVPSIDGDARGMRAYGVLNYLDGEDVDGDVGAQIPKELIAYAFEYQKVAKIEEAIAKAHFDSGVESLKGWGAEKGAEGAARRFRKAADLGHAEAQYRLGFLYRSGDGVEKDAEEGARWYRKAADQGLAEAQFYLGIAYGNGAGIEKDTSAAAEWFRKAADQGHAEAQARIGIMYSEGIGVEKDARLAATWYRKAADQGIADAQSNLGICLMRGEGVEKNAEEGARWILKAADQGSVDAQMNMGINYRLGYGVEKNAEQAVKWYRKAADQGNVLAQHNLAQCYYRGIGVKKNMSMAAEYHRRAAEKGNAPSQHSLGVLYQNGTGVVKSASEAAKWFRKAADQGYPPNR